MKDSLLQSLEEFEIDRSGIALPFAKRLARENAWSVDYAERVVREYKRFVFLAMRAGHPVTPSEQVDQAWHLHLTYSRDYWQLFCPEVLGADLHHGPTAGGQAERSRYYEQYAQTLASYEAAFGEPPPPDIWPPAARRFGSDPLSYRVNPADVVTFPKRLFWPVLAVMALVVMVAVLAGRSL